MKVDARCDSFCLPNMSDLNCVLTSARLSVVTLTRSALAAAYSCALLRDILLQGRLYISRNWLCFYANLFGKDIKVSDDITCHVATLNQFSEFI